MSAAPTPPAGRISQQAAERILTLAAAWHSAGMETWLAEPTERLPAVRAENTAHRALIRAVYDVTDWPTATDSAATPASGEAR